MDVYDMDEINEALIHLEGLADTFTAMDKDIEVTPEQFDLYEHIIRTNVDKLKAVLKQ